MNLYRRYRRGRAPVGAIVIRLVRSGDEIAGFVREVEETEEEDAVHPTEQKPVDQVLRLARNKAQPGSEIFVEMEPGVDWNVSGGRLED